MNKRLLKRHKRQVLRAKERVKVSEPDVRTPDQVAAAREASRSLTGRRTDPGLYYSTPAAKSNSAAEAGESTESANS